MAKTAPKAALTLTVHVEFVHDHEERWFRDTLPQAAFQALARTLSKSIAGQVSDVQRITVSEPARRNLSPVFEFTHGT